MIKRPDHLTDTTERLEGQATHLVRFLATGGDSPTVRAELRTIETTLDGLRGEQATIEKAAKLPQPRMHPAWITNTLQRLDELLRRDPQRAKAEILKAREGELFERLSGGRVRCYACGHRCLLPPGQRGICKVRSNEDGRLSADRS